MGSAPCSTRATSSSRSRMPDGDGAHGPPGSSGCGQAIAEQLSLQVADRRSARPGGVHPAHDGLLRGLGLHPRRAEVRAGGPRARRDLHDLAAGGARDGDPGPRRAAGHRARCGPGAVHRSRPGLLHPRHRQEPGLRRSLRDLVAGPLPAHRAAARLHARRGAALAAGAGPDARVPAGDLGVGRHVRRPRPDPGAPVRAGGRDDARVRQRDPRAAAVRRRRRPDLASRPAGPRLPAQTGAGADADGDGAGRDGRRRRRGELSGGGGRG